MAMQLKIFLTTALLSLLLSTGFTTENGAPILDVDDAVLLMIDHQAGLISLVQDYTPEEFKNAILALAGTAKLADIPTILTTSYESGPNGPMVPELLEMFPDAPYIARPGQINAWDNEDFVKAIEKTGRKKLIVAGVVTDVCVVFPVLAALKEGYEVYVVVDACGTFNKSVRDAAISRMVAAGAQMMNWFAVACELQKDWRNNEEGLANLLSNHIALYKALIESYTRQQEVGNSRG